MLAALVSCPSMQCWPGTDQTCIDCYTSRVRSLGFVQMSITQVKQSRGIAMCKQENAPSNTTGSFSAWYDSKRSRVTSPASMLRTVSASMLQIRVGSPRVRD